MNFSKVRADPSLLQPVSVNLRGAGIYIKGTPLDDLIKSIPLLSSRGAAHSGRGLGARAWNPLSKQCFSGWTDQITPGPVNKTRWWEGVGSRVWKFTNVISLTGKATPSERCRVPAASRSPAERSLVRRGMDEGVTEDAAP